MQLEVKTILNRIQRFTGFIYRDVRLRCRALCAVANRGAHRAPSKCSGQMRAVPPVGAHLRSLAGAQLVVRPAVGHQNLFSLRAAAGAMPHAPGRGRAQALERWQTTGNGYVDVFSFPVGPAAVVARDGAGLPDQLGMCLSVGRVVRALGSGPSPVGRRAIHRGRRNPLGPRPASR